MMETKWTKGPWVVNDVSVRKDDGSLIGLVYSNGEGSMEANAHLIAAAPDLYEALDRLISLVNAMIESGQRPYSSSTNQALAAPAKARGES